VKQDYKKRNEKIALKLDLYKVDLRSVVSKYIGETEKNLNRVFREAQKSGSILFFDEADAIFGKRSGTRGGHDRYANIDVANLLQKFKDHKRIVFLALNIENNIDHALARRMKFWIEFPSPADGNRLKVWKSLMR
jgi:SpoVK/Ycf46/Vps4 family AAA+-type ATPase